MKKSGGPETPDAAAAVAPTTLKKNRLGLPPPKRIDVANKAVADELFATQNVLYLQQEDYYKSQEHVQLLSGEIDALKQVIVNKQHAINKGNKEIALQKDRIEVLEEEVEQTKIERSAFKVLEDQNNAVSQKLVASSALVEKLENQIKTLQDGQTDVRKFADDKMKNAVKTEILLQAQVSHLTMQLGEAQILASRAAAEESRMRNMLIECQKHLKLTDELRVEQMNRSRSTEYKTLRKYDEMSAKYQNERDDKEKLRESVRLALLRGDLLQERLANSLEKKEEDHQMVETIVSQVEANNDAMRGREQVLERENMHLTAQLKLSQKAVKDVLHRYSRLEKLLEEEIAKNAALAKAFRLSKTNSASIGKANNSSTMLGGGGGGVGGTTNSSIASGAPGFGLNKAPLDTNNSMGINNATKQFMSSLAKLTKESALGIGYDDVEEEVAALATADPFYGNSVPDFQGRNEEYAFASNTAPLPLLPKNTSSSTSSSTLPEIVTTDSLQLKGKINLLSNYLQLLVGLQAVPAAVTFVKEAGCVDLSKCAMTDENLKHSFEWFRLLSLRDLRRIDLSHNMLTSRIVETFCAWLIALDGGELLREYPLEIDLRHNHLTPRAIERIELKLKQTPRSEIHLITSEMDNQIIVLVGASGTVMRIDFRQNGKAKKPTLKQQLALGGPTGASLPPHLEFPGGSLPAKTMIYPRDGVFLQRSF